MDDVTESLEGEATRAKDALLKKKRELEKQLEEVRDEFRKTSGKFLCEHYAPLFAEHPEVKGFRWTQYTPYFNDGDVCEFSSNHGYGSILLVRPDGAPDDESDFDPFEYADWFNYDSPEYHRLNPINKKFRGHFPDLSDDDMEALFGDHVEVTIYPDRVEVEEYDHE